jgi:hypothetical protein
MLVSGQAEAPQLVDLRLLRGRGLPGLDYLGRYRVGGGGEGQAEVGEPVGYLPLLARGGLGGVRVERGYRQARVPAP